jgi:hypothetical protein
MAHLRSHIRSIVDHDGAVILDAKNDVFYGANSTGAYIWSGLLRGESVDQIACALAADCGVDLQTVYSDIESFLADLKAKRLLRFDDRSPQKNHGE